MISILCSNCRTPYTVPDHLAGKTVTCKKCGALLDVPSPLDRRPSSSAAATAYERVLGKQNPVALEILGIHARLDPEGGAGEITKFILSFRHIILLFALIAFWISYAQTPDSAELAAPVFLAAGVLLLVAGWLQISMTSRKLAAAISGGTSNSLLPHILSSFLLITSDWRAAMPALRTFFLATLSLIAAFSLASFAGGARYVLPIRYLPSLTISPPANSEPTPETPAPSETPAPMPPVETRPAELPPTPPTSPTTSEKPIPPPDDTTPIPPPP